MNNLDNMVGSSKVIKIQVTSADIIVNGTVDKPYYEIKYREIGCGEYHIGYGSYDLNNVFEWLNECFELVSPDEQQTEHDKEGFNMDMVIEQIEDYGKYKGILKCDDGMGEYYLPVSIAKLIVRARGMGGVLGYLEETK